MFKEPPEGLESQDLGAHQVFKEPPEGLESQDLGAHQVFKEPGERSGVLGSGNAPGLREVQGGTEPQKGQGV